MPAPARRADREAEILGGVSLRPAPAAVRLILRGTAAVEPASAALGLAIPARPCSSTLSTDGSRAALWLGPDEWLLLLPGADADRAMADLSRALATTPHSLVEVSDRQVGLIVEGEQAATALNMFVPLDLAEAAFPLAMATRTLLEKAEIVLWRRGVTSFHVEVWRSFSPYVVTLLEAARQELRAEHA
jgi:sarcosine oxidase subunit gamma